MQRRLRKIVYLLHVPLSTALYLVTESELAAATEAAPSQPVTFAPPLGEFSHG